MDEEISIINSNTRTEKIKNYLVSNKKKIIISILIIIIIIFAIFIFKEVEDRNKIKLSNQYYEATAAFENGDKSKAKQILNLVILKEDATYSPLALYFLIDKELIKSTDLINENYDKIINNLDLEEEIKFLIIYKKALYNSDFVNESEIIDIMSPVINILEH